MTMLSPATTPTEPEGSPRKPALGSNHPAAQHRVRTWVYRGLAALAVLAMVVGTVIAFRAKPVVVEVRAAVRGPMLVTVDEDGSTRVKDRYTVTAPLAGSLARIERHAGDLVQRGSALARIFPSASPLLDPRSRAEAVARVAAADAAWRQTQAAIGRAQALADQAGREAARERSLLAAGASAPRTLEQAELEQRTRTEELASARFAARVAEHELALARATLGRLTAGTGPDQMEVRSPVDGQVLRVLRESEGSVQPGTPLLQVGDPAALEIVVDVLSGDAVGMRPGARVAIERWGGDSALQAHVRRVEPSAFTRISALGVEGQRVNVIVDLDEPHERWATLGDAFRVEARIVVWERADVLQVPSGAVFRHGTGWATYVVEGDMARLRPVTIGKQNGSDAEILDGLRPGDRVIVYPSDEVAEGVQVRSR